MPVLSYLQDLLNAMPKGTARKLLLSYRAGKIFRSSPKPTGPFLALLSHEGLRRTSPLSHEGLRRT